MSSIYKLPSSKTRVVIRKRGIYKSASFDKASDAKSWTLETEAVIEANRHGLFASKSATKASTIHGTIHRKP